MDLTDWKTVSEIASNLATVVAVVIGGLWILWKFVLQREAHAKIEFDLELNVIGSQAGSIVVEVIAKVTNKGLVRHWLRDFRFDLLYLAKDVPITLGDKNINEQVLFQPVFKKRYWIPPDWIRTFIDPGVSQRYTYVAAAPETARFLLVFAQFKYPDTKSEFHTAQKVFTIEGDGGSKIVNPGAQHIV